MLQCPSTCSAIEGRTIMSSRPWVTRTGTDRREKMSVSSISRAMSAPRISAGTAMFQHSAALHSSSGSGLTVHERRKRRIAAMFARRSGAEASWALSRKPGPMWSNEGGRKSTAGADEIDPGNPGVSIGAKVVGDDEAAIRPRHEHRPVEAGLFDDRRQVVCP